MERRKFLKYATATLASPFIFQGQWINAMAGSSQLTGFGAFNPQRKLVLIQLNGGNDGLNMLIPISQYDNLVKARANILVPQAQILKLNEETGLHPVMPELTNLYKDGKVQFIQGVGYPNPNLSHFRSKDIVTSASDSNVVDTSGWVGRMLSAQYPDYPAGFPNVNQPHPIALSIGSTSSSSCQGSNANYSSVLTSLSSSYSNSSVNGELPDSPFGKELRFLINAMEQTESYLDVIKAAAAKAKNLSTLYPTAGLNSLADQLKLVANLIAGGLQTQIYVVNLGGWDTHSLQVSSETDKLTGSHPTLLGKLSKAIAAFQDDLQLMGKANEVMGFVFSEFGRRIKSNDSLGTDHGTSWPAIIFGTNVSPGLTGKNPVIPASVSKTDNLAMQNDFRSIYSSIYKQWFELGETEVNQILGKSFPDIKLVSTGTSVPSVLDNGEVRAKVWPNPSSEKIWVSFVSDGTTQISLVAMNGQQLSVNSRQKYAKGEHQIELQIGHLTKGAYQVVVQSRNKSESVPIFVK